MKTNSDKDLIIFILGNKSDIIEKRQVNEEEINEFCQRHQVEFFETSAKENIQISVVFNELGKKIKEKIDISKNVNRITNILKTNEAIVPYKGLYNLGNTCYMNSFLQSLFLTNEFKKKLLEENREKCPPIIRELIKLFENLNADSKNNSYVNPENLKNRLMNYYRSSTNQEDVFLFGTALFDYIEEKYKEHDLVFSLYF